VTRALALAIIGCSWGIQRPPATDPGTRPVACTWDYAAPIADVTGALVTGVLATLAGFEMSAIGDDSSEAVGYRNTIWVLGGTGVLVYAFAAHSGFANVARCRQLNKPT